MPVTRKDFLKSSSILLGGAFLGGSRFLNIFPDEPKGFKTLKDNIGIFTDRGGTILWYASKTGIAVVDAQSPDAAKNFISGLKTKSDKRIDYLFNTHHHGDHTAGNIYLKDFADKIVANENCARLQKEKNGGGEKEKTQAYPNLTFQEHSLYGLGSEQIEAYHFIPAHTGGDGIYHFVNSGIVHMGDLVFNRVYPYFNLSDGGSLKGWVSCLEKALNKFPNNTIFVFGHSSSPDNITGTKDDLTYMKNYISALLEFVEKEKKAGKSKEEISKAASIPKFETMKGMWEGALKNNIVQAFDELSK